MSGYYAYLVKIHLKLIISLSFNRPSILITFPSNSSQNSHFDEEWESIHAQSCMVSYLQNLVFVNVSVLRLQIIATTYST